MCSKTVEHMRLHALESNPDVLMRHPRDGEAWKTFDRIHSGFSSDPRNIRLGLASDGFNPFGTMSSTYSTWPVFLIPYNLPPWMCMKHTSFILSMIIPGKQTPGNNRDVYFQPLVKELRELWNDGVETFDSSLNETFRVHAALM
uniref:TNP2, partial n=1 Tax=Solanum tuberosum TaxID=4113 RepID=M1CWK3_SOLTU